MVSIVECGRTTAGDYVAFDIRWDGDVTQAHRVTWAMVVTSEDSSDELTLGYTRVDGRLTEQYVDDRASGRRQVVDEDADLRDDELTARFPGSVVGVAVEWPTWKAVLDVDGEVSEQAANAH